MRPGAIQFTPMERVVFGTPAAAAVAAEAQRLHAARVFVVASRTLATRTDEVARIAAALGERHAGTFDGIGAHAPQENVVACANAAREAGADLVVAVGGSSIADAGKIVPLCLEHGVRTVDDLAPFRATVDAEGRRHYPDFRPPRVPVVCVPTTLSGGEFHFRSGARHAGLNIKHSFAVPGMAARSVVLDPAVTVHTPRELWMSTGVRAVDHAVETLASLDANAYTDGAAWQALRLLGPGLRRVMADPGDLDARLDCQIGAWCSMGGIVAGMRMGASHGIGHMMGGVFGVPHGITSCVMLAPVLRYNEAVNGKLDAAIAAALGGAGRRAGDVVADLVRELQLPGTLHDVGIGDADLPELARMSLRDDWTHSNPRPIRSADDVMRILETCR